MNRPLLLCEPLEQLHHGRGMGQRGVLGAKPLGSLSIARVGEHSCDRVTNRTGARREGVKCAANAECLATRRVHGLIRSKWQYEQGHTMSQGAQHASRTAMRHNQVAMREELSLGDVPLEVNV